MYIMKQVKGIEKRYRILKRAAVSLCLECGIGIEAEKMYFIKTTGRNIDRARWKAYSIINDRCVRRCEEMYVHDQRDWTVRRREKHGYGF